MLLPTITACFPAISIFSYFNNSKIPFGVADKYPNKMKLLKNEKNITLGPTLNRCIELVEGKLTVTADENEVVGDSDDIITTDENSIVNNFDEISGDNTEVQTDNINE